MVTMAMAVLSTIGEERVRDLFHEEESVDSQYDYEVPLHLS